MSRAKKLLGYLRLAQASFSEMKSEEAKVNHMLGLRGKGPEAFREFEKEVQAYLNQFAKENNLEKKLMLRELVELGSSPARLRSRLKSDPYYSFYGPYDYIFMEKSPLDYFNYLKEENLL